MIGRSDWLHDDADLSVAASASRARRVPGRGAHGHTTELSSAELLEEGGHVPHSAGPVLDEATVPDFEQFVARRVFQPSASGRLRQPRTPYRLDGGEPPPPGPGPEPRARRSRLADPGRAGAADRSAARRRADPRLHRLVGGTGRDPRARLPRRRRHQGGVGRSPRPHALRGGEAAQRRPVVGMGADLRQRRANQAGHRARSVDTGGRLLFERLVAVPWSRTTPRVMEQFGLGWDRLHAVNPAVVLVRMPAFGLDGPWRDRTGFAQTMESITGLAADRLPDGPPVLVRCVRPARRRARRLRHAARAPPAGRDRPGRPGRGDDGRGRAERRGRGGVRARLPRSGGRTGGNRSDVAAPQGVYRCAGDDSWVALRRTTEQGGAAHAPEVAVRSLARHRGRPPGRPRRPRRSPRRLVREQDGGGRRWRSLRRGSRPRW